MVVVARHNHDLPPGEGTSKLLEERASCGQRVSPRPVTQLQDVAEQHESLNAVQSLDQGRPWPGAAQHVGAGSGPQVQIGYDQGAHDQFNAVERIPAAHLTR